MNIGLIVNARGKMCIVHDELFPGVPLWVAYHTDKMQLEIIFESGATYPIDWRATPEMDQYIRKIDKILIIRMEEKKPIEGYDASLCHIYNGRVILLPMTLPDGSTLETTQDGELRLTLAAFGFAQPPETVDYDPLGQSLFLVWSDGTRQPLGTLPAPNAEPTSEAQETSFGEAEYVDYHDHLVSHTHVRVVWSPGQGISDGGKSDGFNVVLPISLSFEASATPN
jgi:hypothetical protein